MLRRHLFGLLGLMLFLGAVTASAEAPLPEKIEFNRDVRPILSDFCFQCHGPDQHARQADLRLDTLQGLIGTADHPGVVRAGKSADSELVRRVTSTDPEEMMPPPKASKRLAPRDIAVLKKWVEQGAEYQGHWAYIPPQRSTPPQPVNAAAARNEIDAFVRARLASAGLVAAPAADKRTLHRRLSLDLTGLPPRPEDVERFVNDTHPDAYERLVDDLLKSPRFGERMAVYWLDLVRFADTIGYHSDNVRDITPYRDYVIQAFNENKPFDQFTIEQLAGDLVVESGLTQKIAAGYNRLLQTTEEGGAQAKEYAAKYLADRVRNVSSVWLGGTMACSECHDHKYDPYTQRDFYSLAAFFADIQETPVGRREAGMLVPSEEQSHELQLREQAVTQAMQRLDAQVQALVVGATDWSVELAGTEWTLPKLSSITGSDGLIFTTLADGSQRVTGNVPERTAYQVTLEEIVPDCTALQLEAFAHPDLPAKGPGHSDNGNFVLTEWQAAIVDPSGKEQPLKFVKAAADHAQDGFPIASAIDGKNDTGWAVLPQTGLPHAAVAQFEQPLKLPEGSRLLVKLKFDSPYARHSIGHFRLMQTTHPEPATTALPSLVRAAMSTPPDQRTSEQKQALTSYLKDQSPRLASERQGVADANKAKDQHLASIPRSLTVKQVTPAMVRILPRGNWMDDSGAAVEPAVPAFLGKLQTADRRANRLDLAKWLVEADNPLTARVMVNRMWKLLFGVGLCKTVEDLGSQGEWPTHPELLDWLAVELRDSGWNVKHILRLMVLSQTYQQTSQMSAEARAADPYNRLLSAQNRFRLDAEFVRDNALEIAGLLSPRIGGESVKPYQPEGYWDYLNFPRRTYPQDHGERLYRRGLYTHWQRSFLHPEMLVFDAPSREECVADRPRSNTPQQALTLLNDPAYVEAARVFAAKILSDGGASDDERLVWAFTRAVARPPRAEELVVLRGLLQKHQQQYASDASAATALLKSTGEAAVPEGAPTAELAAWTSIARAILNLHETLTRL